MNPLRLRTLFEYVLDNLFDLATILVAGYLVIRHQIRPFGPSDIADLLTGILAVLGLIAVSGLWDRNRRLGRIEKLAQESHDVIQQRIAGHANAGEFFLAESEINASSFAAAMAIDLAGMTLTRTLLDYQYVLSQRLQAGANIRIIVVDPQQNEALNEMVRRSNIGDATAKFWRDRIESSQEIIQAIAKTPQAKGVLQIGYLPYAPAFGLILVDSASSHGLSQVEIYHHRSSEDKVTFMVRSTKDPHWFGFFERQFGILWNSCRVEQLLPSSAP